MNTIPTAEELIVKMYPNEYRDIDRTVFTGKQLKEVAIALAKLHVEAALKAADENVEIDGPTHDEEGYRIVSIIKGSITNAYPLDNIK